MSDTNIVKPDSASHWYIADDKSVKSFHHVPYAGKRGKAGEVRSTSLRDARKVGAYPSVTNILQILQKDFLTAYKINQAILACVTLPKIDGETADDFGKRALKDSKEHAASAARLGSACHEVGAGILLDPRSSHTATSLASTPPKGLNWFSIGDDEAIGLPADVLKDYLGVRVEGRDLLQTSMPLIRLIQGITPDDAPTDAAFSEFHIANCNIGYAGCCDGLMFLDTTNKYVYDKLAEAGYLHLLGSSDPVLAVGDIKTRGAAAKKTPIYETDILQLAAYLNAIPTTPNLGYQVDSSNTPVCNLMLNTHANAGKDGVWEAELIIHPKDDVDKAWETFKHLHAVWCWMKSYDPAEPIK
tara:strand:+ start:581 stop:1651 length:1071 start_codon:yes stop_codon:yes gene_type:complete